MSASVSVDLAYPPSANRLWRSVRGRVIRSPEYETWLNSAAWEVKQAVGKTYDRTGIPGPYGLCVIVCPPDRRARDLDNLVKPINDALVKGGAVVDDKFCQELEMEWMPNLGPGVYVTVMTTKLRIPVAVKRVGMRRRRGERAAADALPGSGDELTESDRG